MSVVGPSRIPTVTVPGPVGVLAVHDLPAAGARPRATVVLVPGYTGSKEDFSLVARLIAAAGHRYVALDLRGQHESPGPEDASAYAVDALAQDVLAVCRATGDAPVHLVGHSFGGLVARAAVLQDPAVTRSLTLMGSGPAAVTGATAERARVLQRLVGTMSQAEVADYAEATDPALAARPATVRAFLRRRFVAHSRTGLLAMADAILSEPDRVAELAAVNVPVHVVHGVADDAWSPAAQREMAQRLGAAYTVVEGSVHSPAVEQPRDTARALASFWAEVEATVPAR